MSGRAASLLVLGALAAGAALLLLAWPRATGPGAPHPQLAVPTPPARPGPETLTPPDHPTPGAGGGVILGTVRRDGAGVPARVEVRADARDDAEPIAAGEADGDGAYRLAGLPAGHFEVTARDARSAAVAEVDFPAPGVIVRADLDLPDAGPVLRGRAVHADGRAFRGRVSARSRSASSGPAPVTTDEDGRFAIPGLSRGEVRLVATAGDGFRRETRVAVPRDDEFVFVVDGGDHVAAGTVLDDATGAPIAGAAVRLAPYAEREVAAASTGPDGRFRLSLPVERVTLRVEAPGYEPVATQIVHDGMRVRLRRASEVAGRVVTEDGEAVAGIGVFGLGAQDWPRGLHDAARTTTDADGRFSLDALPRVDAMVFAFGKGFASRELLTQKIDAGYDPLALAAGERTLVVVPVGRIEGTVAEADGEARPGVVVRLRGPRAGAALVRPAATGADGAFVFDTVLPGEYTAYTQSPGRMSASSDPVEVRAGGTARMEIVLPPPRRVRVTVLDAASGKPVAGARVWLNPRTATTNARGIASLDGLSPGQVPLHVYARGYVDERLTAGEGRDDRDDVDVTVRLTPAARVTGTVVAPDGIAPEAARLVIRTGPPRYYTREVAIEPGGAFRAFVPPDQSVVLKANLTADGRQYAGETVAKSGDSGVRVELAETGMAAFGLRGTEIRNWRVRIVGPDGEPIRSARVTISQRAGLGSVSTSALYLAGSLVTVQVTEKTDAAVVEVYEARAADGSALGAGRTGALGPRGGEVELRLPPSGEIAGRVAGPDGAGIPGLRVVAHPVPGPDEPVPNMSRPPHAAGRTDADGRFRLTGLGDGEYTLEVAPYPGLAPAAPTPARPGDRDVEIRLRPPRRITVTARGPDGAPLTGARVTVGGIRGETGADGTVTLTGFGWGVPLSAEVYPPDDRQDLVSPAPVAIEGDAATVVLKRILAVAGRVLDDADAPVPGCAVRREWGESDFDTKYTDATGAFRFDGLSPGPVRLVAGGARTTVPAGTEDVVLRVDPGLVLRFRIEGSETARRVLVRSVDGVAGVWRQEYLKPGAEIAVAGLTADREISFWSATSGDGRYAYWVGHPPADGRVVVVPLREGKSITGRLTLPSDARDNGPSVVLYGKGFTIPGRILAGGRYRISGVPDGTFRVHAAIIDDSGRERHLDRKVAAGTDADLVIP